ncbi:sugar ABC transporter permease [Actinocrinis sp.]|uniref:carbohydrate ABC transporter permease n=1 Tax=Actinocrinis sp. TaxID=1920516 RepID=UPI002D2F8481|nr:sugar ABC transporter permease [Actinocrinis sp.]HZP51247.1 sugar ABC transporter permease [Actinocrinis sp.]
MTAQASPASTPEAPVPAARARGRDTGLYEPVAPPARRPAPRRRIRRTGRRLMPWLYLAPVLVFIGVFKLWPTIWGVYLSFFHVRPYLGNQYVAGANYQRAFSDPDLRAAVLHTVIDAVGAVAGSILVGFALALLLEGPARHLRILRTAVFLPTVVAMVAAASLWQTLLYPSRYGAVNSLLGAFGAGPAPFLSSTHSSLASVILIQVWKNAPYDMVIFVAGLAGIDRQLYEAAHLDGAGALQRLRYVTLPSLRPITTIVLTLGIIRGLRVFTEIWVATSGGPAGSTQSVVTYVYEQFSENNDAGYAAAIGTLLLAVTILLTCLNLWWRNRREAW